MGDMGDDFRAWREERKAHRDRHAMDCEGCITNHPKRNPSKLYPGQKCRWCGWRRPGELGSRRG